MKWAVLFFNIVTLAVLAYTVSLQMGELGYYDSVEADALKSAGSAAEPVKNAPADVKADPSESAAADTVTDTDPATEPAADTAPAEEAA